MAGSRRVQSARTSATFFAANCVRTSSELSTSLLLTWHVTHHAAVEVDEHGSARGRKRRYGVRSEGPQSGSTRAARRSAAFADGMASPATNNGHAMTADVTSATSPATAQGRAPPVRTMRHVQSVKPMPSRTISKRNSASLSRWAPSTHASQITVHTTETPASA
jgi:hypothetical protein